MGKKGIIHPVYGCTESVFFGKFRSAIRKEWKNSQMHKTAILNARRPCTDGSRRKWIVPCIDCKTTYYLNERIDVPRATGKGLKTVKAYSVHHKEECGSCRSFEEIGEFARKVNCSTDGLEVLCYACHTKIHNTKKEK